MEVLTEKRFVDLLEDNFNKEGFLSRREIDFGYGVADLILINKKNIFLKNIKKRLDFNQFGNLLDDRYFEILEHIPDFNDTNKPIEFKILQKKLNISEQLLKYNLLRYLEQNNFIKKINKHYYFKINGWLPLADEVLAFEAKIKNWKRGFLQANRYKLFADRVFLVIPPEIEHRVNLSLLVKYRIGLIVFNYKSGNKKYLLNFERQNPSNNFKKNLAIELFWKFFFK